MHLLSTNFKNKIYRTVILQVVLYLCAMILHVKEEHRLRTLENRMLRKVLGPGRVEVSGDWRKLQKDKLYNMYSLPDIIGVIKARRMSWARNVTHMEELRNVCRCTGGEPKGKRLHFKNVVIDGSIILVSWRNGMAGVDWICLDWVRDKWYAFMKMVLNLWFS